MIRINLNKDVDENPIWWNNFVDVMSSSDILSLEEIYLILENLHCKFLYDQKGHYWLEFDTEEDLNYFILKWS